jgi:inorganic pyrophosphatase
VASQITAGAKAPETINVVIEIRRGERNKYEMDKDTGYLTLDRVNGTALGYPTDYGYIPATLCEDGDPLDALLIIDESVPHNTLVPCRPIGVLYMVDEGENDEKLIVLPVNDVSKDHITDLSDLGENFQKMVMHFYTHYKDWKKGWTGVEISFNGWGDASAAKKIVVESIERAQAK